MASIQIEKNPPKERLESMDVFRWPVWSKEVSTFSWTYDSPETCYILEGEVVVTPEGGKPVTLEAGDLVTFPAGMSCTWEVRRPIRKHYTFG